jgi:hypothetical protein
MILEERIVCLVSFFPDKLFFRRFLQRKQIFKQIRGLSFINVDSHDRFCRPKLTNQ